MDREEALRILEIILFISDEPVTPDDLARVLDGLGKEEVPELVEDLKAKLDGHGLQILEIADGYQLRSCPEYGQYVKKFHKLTRSTRLSQASIETLSMIAYKQPITRQEVEDIRGVDSSGVVKTILDKGLIKTMGRKKVAGRPMTYGTTKKFLEYFGLSRLSDLPTLKDLPDDEGVEAFQESIEFTGDEETDEEIMEEIEDPSDSDDDSDDDSEDDDALEEELRSDDDGQEDDEETEEP